MNVTASVCTGWTRKSIPDISETSRAGASDKDFFKNGVRNVISTKK
jgi:hypothetical protein